MATDRTVVTRLKMDVSNFVRGAVEAKAALKGLTSEIDTTNDRTAYLAQGLLAIGPTLAPIGAAAVPIFTGLATQLTIAGVAATTTGLAFNGIGDALKALRDYQLEPTDAHLQKLTETMSKIGPEGQRFVLFIDEIRPKLAELANQARAGLLPGVQEGIENLLGLLPQVSRIISETSKTLGSIADDAGAALAGPKFADFFDFLERDAQPILAQMAATAGHFVDGFAAMLVAFEPLSVQFSSGFEEMSRSFAEWAHGLQDSQSFQEFVLYVEQSGPKVADVLSSLGNAFVQLLEAAAPIGDVMLPILSDLLDVISAIADSPLGPVFIGLGAAVGIYGRAVAIAQLTTGGFIGKLTGTKTGIQATTKAAKEAIPTWAQFKRSVEFAGQAQANQSRATREANTAMKGFLKPASQVAGTIGLFAASSSGLADKLGLANTASFAFAGSLAGPLGTAIGATTGLVVDAIAAMKDYGDTIKQADLAAESGSEEMIRAAQRALAARANYLATSNSVGANFSRVFSHGGEDLIRASLKLQQGLRDIQHPGRELDTLLTQSLNPSIQETASAYELAAREGKEFDDTIAGINDSLSGTDALLAYRRSIRDLRKALFDKERGPGVNTQTDAGIQNLQDIQSVAHDIVNVLSTIDDPARRGRFLTRSLGELTTLANKFDSTGETAKRLKTQFGVLASTPKIEPKVGMDTSEFDAKKKAIRGFLNGISENPYKVKIGTSIDDPVLKRILGIIPISKSQDGDISGLLLGPGKASGGWTGPGAKYTPAGVVHRDEFVFSKEATHGNVAFLEGLHNAMRGYDTGGYVTPSAPSFDMSELADLVASMRPVVGTQVIQPHNYSEFRREQDQYERMANSGGPRRGGRR